VIPARVIVRLLTNVEHTEGGCIISRYSVGSHGYSQIGWAHDGERRMMLGHRVAWEATFGEIPDSLTIDHECRNRRCINPDHLRLMSNVENARDNGNARKTACPAGHQYDEVNTYVDRKGHRRCRGCIRARKLAA
jgi:HNH endonuclease